MTQQEKKLLSDIMSSVQSIDEHLQYKRDLSLYKSSKTVRRAVEREFEIIGEASGKLLRLNPKVALSNARLMVDLRNKVIHAYDNVNDMVMWKIIMQDLPVLRQEVAHLLSN